mgnify:CR=1 FL=1
MPLRRISTQTRTFEEDYLKYSKTPGNLEMIQLLPALRELCEPFEVWGLTSHYTLWLLAADNWQAPWLVSVWYDVDQYEVNYLMPDGTAPFPRAFVRGFRNSVPETAELIRIAMKQCGGWSTI